MARRLLAGVAVAAAVGSVGAAAGCGAQAPGGSLTRHGGGGAPVAILRSAGIVDRHLVAEVSVGDLRPVELAVAKLGSVDADGALLRKNVFLQETIQLPSSATGVTSWRSHKALRPGTYFVQVEAVETGGVTDCRPFQRNCLAHWSSVRRVVVHR